MHTIGRNDFVGMRRIAKQKHRSRYFSILDIVYRLVYLSGWILACLLLALLAYLDETKWPDLPSKNYTYKGLID